MLEHRPAVDHGRTVNDRLAAVHHFCFAGYQRSGRESWGALQVLNHNLLAPGAELNPEPVDNVDMLHWVRKGVMGQHGSLGQRHLTLVGEARIISTGSGITHGTLNRGNQPVDHVEIWLATARSSGEPDQQVVRPKLTRNPRIVTLASGFPEDVGVARLRANARVSIAKLPRNGRVSLSLERNRRAYLAVVTGSIMVGDRQLQAPDGLAIADHEELTLTATQPSEIILVESR